MPSSKSDKKFLKELKRKEMKRKKQKEKKKSKRRSFSLSNACFPLTICQVEVIQRVQLRK